MFSTSPPPQNMYSPPDDPCSLQPFILPPAATLPPFPRSVPKSAQTQQNVKFDVSNGKKEIGPNLSTPDKKLR